MTHTKYIRDHTVKYEDTDHHVERGISHLEDTLSHDEARTLFDDAHHSGEASFRTSDNHSFALVYQHDSSGNGQYRLIPKS